VNEPLQEQALISSYYNKSINIGGYYTNLDPCIQSININHRPYIVLIYKKLYYSSANSWPTTILIQLIYIHAKTATGSNSDLNFEFEQMTD
jgi:hypothetical protein